ncbi:hypothetical protein Tco_1319001 [Tanacetum coccineum]
MTEGRVAQHIIATLPNLVAQVTASLSANQGGQEGYPASGPSTIGEDRKRKFEDQPRKGVRGNPNYKKKVARGRGVAAQKPGRYADMYPKCAKCNFHHLGNCPLYSKCKQTGHHAKYYSDMTKTKGKKAGLQQMWEPILPQEWLSNAEQGLE